MRKNGMVVFSLLLIALSLSIIFYTGQNNYQSVITNGISLYTPERIQAVTMDEYFLLSKIADITKQIPQKNIVYLQNKYKNNPYKRLFDKNDYSTTLRFERNDKRKGEFDFYVLKNVPDSIIASDGILLKALYCDKVGYTDEDFTILSTLKKNTGDYYDTHYVIGLLFLTSNHCFKKDILEKEIQKTSAVIAQTAGKDHTFSDLYAERIVVLYWAGYGKHMKKEWIDLVAKSFNKGYGLGDTTSFNAHATALSLLSLLYYTQGKTRQLLY